MKNPFLVIALTIGALFFVYFAGMVYLRANFWDFGRDNYNLEVIGDAYAKYYETTKEFPGSLEDLVKKGLLPESSRIYLEPPGFANREVDFRQGNYEVFPPAGGIVENVEDCSMLGRREVKDGKVVWVFASTGNAILRDKIKAIAGSR